MRSFLEERAALTMGTIADWPRPTVTGTLTLYWKSSPIASRVAVLVTEGAIVSVEVRSLKALLALIIAGAAAAGAGGGRSYCISIISMTSSSITGPGWNITGAAATRASSLTTGRFGVWGVYRS